VEGARHLPLRLPRRLAHAIGRPITFTGTGTRRSADGQLAEYWANADSPLFVQQHGVRESPQG
jgi:hypothetical protein